VSIQRIITPLAAAVALLAATAASAQSDTTRAPADTSTLASEGFHMTKSPTVAVLLSIVPGGGQVYNEQYIKAALFVGVGGFFAFQAVRYNTLFLDKAAQVDAVGLDDSTGVRSQLKAQREVYRDNRDLNIAYFVGVELLSMIDAYVGAHLFDFDVDGGDDGLSSRLYLDPLRPGIGLAMRW
jgi:hypothetical protein